MKNKMRWRTINKVGKGWGRGRVGKKKSKQLKKERIRNKKLCKLYPWLIPRRVWTDEVFWIERPFDHTELDAFPDGWRKAFGKEMMEDLRKELIRFNFLHEFRVMQIKEKYGTLRFYTGCVPIGSKINEIIDKYEHISAHTCICCGRVDVPVIDDGWVSPYCKKCYKKICDPRGWSNKVYDDFVVDDSHLSSSFKITSRLPGGEEKVRIVDVTDILERMRKRNPQLFED